MARPRRRRRGSGHRSRVSAMARALLRWLVTLTMEATEALLRGLVVLITGRVFSLAKALLRWLVTLLIVMSFIYNKPAPQTVAAIAMLLSISWIDSILLALAEVPSPFSSRCKVWRFVRILPEYRLWGSTTKILSVGFVLNTIFPRDLMRLLALSFTVSIYAWLYVLSFMPSR